LICDLLSSEQQLIQERTEAFEYRKKFYPGAGPTAQQAGITDPSAAFGGGGMPHNQPKTYDSYGSTSQGYGGGHGLGSTSAGKTYSPYGGDSESWGGSVPVSMGSVSGQVASKGWDVVSGVAKGLGAAAGTLSSLAGIGGGTGSTGPKFAGSQGPSSYAPPTSMSSEQFQHQQGSFTFQH